jgi:uncharacterized membrane protein YphA (DoxX/SURF4 family)
MVTVSRAEPITLPASGPGWSRISRVVGYLGAAFLGLVLLAAAWAKALDPQAFAQQIHGEKLDFLLPAAKMALLALGLEVGLGAALLLGVRRLWVLVPAVLLVAFFLFLTGRTYWLALHGVAPAAGGCGCFGNLVERSPAEAFWQDLLLLVPALALAFLGRRPGSDLSASSRDASAPRARTAVAFGLAVAAMVFAWKSPDLPLDDLATRLKPGAEIKKMCAGAGADRVCLDTAVPDLGSGAHLVVMADLADPGFQKAVPALNAYAVQGREPAVEVLADVTSEQKQAFFWRWAPSFPIVETPGALLKPLYRRLPRSFVVQAGRVTRTYPGLPPLASP